MPARSCPASRIEPELGVSNPASMRNSVVLPQPEGPSRAKISPRCDVDRDVVDGAVAVEVLDDVSELEKSFGSHSPGGSQPLFIGTGSVPAPPQEIVFSTSARVLIAWSMCDSSTISGGERAMVSPVERTITPACRSRLASRRSRACRARRGRDSSSMAPTRPMLRMSITCGDSCSECTACSKHRRHLGAARRAGLRRS